MSARSRMDYIPKDQRIRVLGWRCPAERNADSEYAKRRYKLWFRLYRSVRVARHAVGVHDWNATLLYGGLEHCDWCGANR